MGVYKLSTAGGLATPRTNYSSFLAGNPAFVPSVDSYLAFTTNDSPYIHTYNINNISGFGTKFSNPATLPPGLAYVPAFSPSGADLLVTHQSTPYVTVYPFSASGYGAKYANPATLLTGNGQSGAWNPAGTVIAATHNDVSPYTTAWPFTSGTGFGTKYANPATIMAGARSVTMTAADIVVTLEGSPYVKAYPFTAASGWGTAYSNPATAIPFYGLASAFSPSGADLAIGHYNSPYVTVYAWSSGFGTKYSDPATLPSGVISNPQGVAFNPAGNILATSHDNGANVSVYPWSSGFGTKYANPTTSPTGIGGVAWNQNGTVLAAAHQITPYISVYPWTDYNGFGAKFADSVNSPPTGNSQGVSFRGV